MKHTTILITEGSFLGSIETSRKGLIEANNYLQHCGKKPVFRVQLAGLTPEISLKGGIYSVHPEVIISRLKKTDLVLIPAFEDDIGKSMKKNQAVIPWLIKQYQSGAELASLCTGAFLLAATGLLQGKNCSTHWRATHDFKKLFPDVQLVTDKIITDEHGIYTSGGAFSSANLVLYIIEKYAGREAAIHCAKTFQVDMDRQSQSPFIIFQGQKDHEDEQIKRAQEFIEHNFDDKITVEKLADMLALGRRSLERRFKKATCNTLVEYIQRVKMEVAKKNFETTRKNINEVMYEVGYSDIKAFRNVFKKITGLSPIEYRNKYNREVMVL
jgi:transcriptional regulator GlxA family with amidase domain